MATTLRRSHSCADYGVIIPHPISGGRPLGFGANAVRRFEGTCDVLALLIDVSLTWVFLLTGVVQAAFLLFMIAGLTLS